ncbi:MAG: transposase [Thermodesulfobacteriota bacterium]
MYAKRPFGGPRQVIEYLGRYTHKVAISNHRITELTEKKVAFSYKDYQKGGQKRRMSLEKEEFIRRFAMHILPSGFVRIRHYGFLASRYKAQKLQIARKTLGSQEVTYIDLPRESRPKPLAYDPQICPACGKKSMQTQEVFLPKRAPPLLYQV